MTEEKEISYIPTPQEILNVALRDLLKALEAAERSQKLILQKLQRSSPVQELERYAKHGSEAPRRKTNTFGEKEYENGIETHD